MQKMTALFGTVLALLLATPVLQAQQGVTILSPAAGSTVSGLITVAAQVNLGLDGQGTYLIVDGAQWGTTRVNGSPFVYPLNTAALTDGAHTLQIWAHDIDNQVVLSPAIGVIVANGTTVTAPPPAPPTTPTSPTSPVISIPVIAGSVYSVGFSSFSIVPGSADSLVFTPTAGVVPLSQLIGTLMAGVQFKLNFNGVSFACSFGTVNADGSFNLNCVAPSVSQ